MESIADLFAQQEWVVYLIFRPGRKEIYIGSTNNMRKRWVRHKQQANDCSSRILTAYPDADYRIVTRGLQCEWDAIVEEQRQLDLHELTKVNIQRAIPDMNADRERRRVNKAKPENKARQKKQAADRWINKQVRLVMDDLLNAVAARDTIPF
tara:strand:+ start:75 stop:530 length:456 start_codon:yes stop_codon:yes gene_type:complete